LPTLKVGLHLVLVRGRTLLPPADVPDLADAYGNLPSDLCRAGVSFFFRPAVRRQLEAEIRAQFAAFGATGLPLDHVNTHHHMHLHPTVCELLLKVGGEYGMAAVRVPNEPWRPRGEGSREGVLRHLAAWVGLRFWVRRLVKRLRQANLQHNDFVFGMRDTGRMSADRVLALLAELPEGVSEMYFHPAVRKSPETPWPKHYACEEELDALTSPVVAAALEASGIRRTSFSELAVAYPVEHGGHGGRRARRG
ncbi:MAG TPA: hopanoid biosynthesis-associated protein HpnK, partial [Candidatus Methylomirabilis sp.]|nr:hopanoid biosynthesis-associated protein HpnK [Candidatus Methylomirabilis sp.]